MIAQTRPEIDKVLGALSGKRFPQDMASNRHARNEAFQNCFLCGSWRQTIANLENRTLIPFQIRSDFIDGHIAGRQDKRIHIFQNDRLQADGVLQIDD